jgi:DNA-binding NtrC family response regulator
MQLMVTYEWPGNVRELKNVIERAMLLEADEEILAEHLPAELSGQGEGNPVPSSASVIDSFFPMTLREIEKIQIEKTLKQTSGNKSKAASLLGISRQTLREKLKVFQAQDDARKKEAAEDTHTTTDEAAPSPDQQ